MPNESLYYYTLCIISYLKTKIKRKMCNLIGLQREKIFLVEAMGMQNLKFVVAHDF